MNERKRKYFILIAIFLFIFSFSVALAVEEECVGEEGDACPLGLAEKVNSFYNWALGIGGIIALGIIVFGGILYITSVGNPGRLSEARAWITAALVGLLILFGSFLILKTLNPKLTKLEDIVLEINPEADVVIGDPGDLGNPQAICTSATECVSYCNNYCTEVPSTGLHYGGPVSCNTVAIEPHEGMLPIDQTIPLLNGDIASVTSASGVRIWTGLVEPLRAAGQSAQTWKNPLAGLSHSIYVISGYRPLSRQLEFACKDIRWNNDLDRFYSFKLENNLVAWPGSSPHGRGNAVDIHLRINGVDYGYDKPKTSESCATLADIMYRAGWGRISTEDWHFQYPAPSEASKTYFNCTG